MISKNLQSLIVKIETLKLDPENARRHSDKSVSAVVQSLEKFGQQKPIVSDEGGVVIAGNSTLRAARRLNWTEIAVTQFTGTSAEKTAYALADNRTAELSGSLTYCFSRSVGSRMIMILSLWAFLRRSLPT